MKKIGRLKTYTSKEFENSYVSIGFECLDRDLFNPEKCYDLLAESGVKYARCQTGWAKCEKEKGVYDFAWLDSITDNLLARGIIPWFCVGFGNPVYMHDVPNPTAVGCVPLYYGKETVDAWKNYVCALAEHYKNRVQYYEIWNEPDLEHFWYPGKPDGSKYAELVNITAQAVHKSQPDAKIGAVVASPYNFYFIDTFLKNSKKENIDFFTYHIYTKFPELSYAPIMSHLRRRLDANGLSHVELWQGESGYPSWAYKGHWLVEDGCNDERPQAVFQLRRYFLDVYNGAKRSSFFQMADMWEKPYVKASEVINKPAAHGILNGITYTPKKSYETIKYLAAIFSGNIMPAEEYIHVLIDTPSVAEQLSCETMTFVRNGTEVYAYYLPVSLDSKKIIRYKASVHIYKPLENPIFIDPYTGEVFDVCKDTNDLTSEEVYNELPIKDYPLILTEKKAFEIVCE
ncbi:MAG: hypothetical protein SOZ34_00150 [Clostridia bacterium]|nr:hypothetical protein [Clostridia bacterium]